MRLGIGSKSNLELGDLSRKIVTNKKNFLSI